MADEDQVRKRIIEKILDIAGRPKSVSFSEIESLVNQLKRFHPIKSRKATHGVLFTVGDRRFMVNTHNPGNAQVKAYSVGDFLDAMTELGWYEE